MYFYALKYGMTRECYFDAELWEVLDLVKLGQDEDHKRSVEKYNVAKFIMSAWIDVSEIDLEGNDEEYKLHRDTDRYAKVKETVARMDRKHAEDIKRGKKLANNG